MSKETIKFIAPDLLLCNACEQTVIYERDSEDPFKFWYTHKDTPAHREALKKQ